MDKNKNRYLSIPYWILLDKKLISGNERIVLAEIISLCKLGKCYASGEHYGDLCGITKDGANKILKRLVEINYIVRRKNGRGNYTELSDYYRDLVEQSIPNGEQSIPNGEQSIPTNTGTIPVIKTKNTNPNSNTNTNPGNKKKETNVVHQNKLNVIDNYLKHFGYSEINTKLIPPSVNDGLDYTDDPLSFYKKYFKYLPDDVKKVVTDIDNETGIPKKYNMNTINLMLSSAKDGIERLKRNNLKEFKQNQK